jgi:hypothetical protein
VVAAEGSALGRDLPKVRLELVLLDAEEPDALGEQASVPAVGDHDLDLALRVPAQARDDAELEQQHLDVACQLLAVRRVGHLDRPPRQQG